MFDPAISDSDFDLATIEVLYHAIAILSHRTSMTDTHDVQRSASKNRQMLATERLTAILNQGSFSQLVFYPFIPYACSLCLSINYREMRKTKIPLFRTRARTAFDINCKTLKRLGQTFRSAAATAEMAGSILEEMDRVYIQVFEESRIERRPSRFATTNGECLIPSRFDLFTLNALLNKHLTFSPMPILSYDTRLSKLTTCLGTTFDSRHQESETVTANDFDPSSFDGIPELDPFEMFDPNFDLDGIDACLGSSLETGPHLALLF